MQKTPFSKVFEGFKGKAFSINRDYKKISDFKTLKKYFKFLIADSKNIFTPHSKEQMSIVQDQVNRYLT